MASNNIKPSKYPVGPDEQAELFDQAVAAGRAGKQDTLVSGTNIKTINGASVLGAGDLTVSSAASWGSITGTLSSQSDLSTALSGKEPTITAGTTAQYYRGDKTFQTLDKTAVGLGNVDNTSDANKPISTATQTALNAKASTGAVTGTGITMSTATILGRSTAGTGAIEEITIGSGLTLSAGTLSASGGGLTVGTTAIASGTIGRVLFQGTGNVLQQSANLFWDNTSSRLGINTALPNMALDIRTGNVGIGVTSDAGFKLDVNGTARVQNTLTVTSSSSNGALSLTQNSVGFAAQYIYRPNVTNTIATLIFQDLKTGANSKSFSLGIGRSGDPQWTNSDFIFGFYTGSGGWQQSAKIFNASGNWAIENGTATSDITTAILQVNSTTKGFLPPRMTNAQMLAIATPAAGLVVYDTTNNKHCGYNGTAWQNFY